MGKYKEIGTKSALIWENTKRMEQIYQMHAMDFGPSWRFLSEPTNWKRQIYDKAVLEGYVGESTKTKWEIYSN